MKQKKKIFNKLLNTCGAGGGVAQLMNLRCLNTECTVANKKFNVVKHIKSKLPAAFLYTDFYFYFLIKMPSKYLHQLMQ